MNIIWKSGERVIPGFGVARTDEPIDLPEDLANKFIKQGMAEVKRSDLKSRRTKDDEVLS